MKSKFFVLYFFLVLVGKPLIAQEPPQDPIDEHIFPPELVMQNQKAISLSSDQKGALKKEIRAAQRKFTDLQWDIEDEMETFLSLLSQEKVDEPKAIAQLEKILRIESEIKRTHLTLAIRIKNLLSPEQQTKLQEIRKKSN